MQGVFSLLTFSRRPLNDNSCVSGTDLFLAGPLNFCASVRKKFYIMRMKQDNVIKQVAVCG